MNDIQELARRILIAEEAARKSTEEADRLKAQLVEVFWASPDGEGAHGFRDLDGHKATITCKISRAVDSDKLLIEVSRGKQHMSMDYPGTCPAFLDGRPSINMAAWKAADSSITAPLLSAITAKAGKPAVKIEKL